MMKLLTLALLLFGMFGSAAAAQPDDASEAVRQLDVHPDLAAHLFAAEPMLANPTSIDIDERGRVWVCEAINYRPSGNGDVIGNHPEGDRILILEDTDGDGRADKCTVFYQGHDIDSPHGVLVMPSETGKGTKAIVSAQGNVFYLIDDNGDLKADRKELLFTGIDGAQHDHGIHAVHFGPDGKLYFNFGNEGHQIKDKAGKPIVDKMGHEVNKSRRPYQEGMVFRCNVDGSEFETLAWNFRNNWEVCLDSFGTMWQSDNDDDGNRAVRINYVMEYGNYGYSDELTGAGWSEQRTNWEAEVPQRHWHLNDPGVIPNLLQTGAGAPTGICMYEGKLLPQKFQGAVVLADAGTGVCRACIAKPDGAGYTATTLDIVSGARNKCFRPSDVCIAPDGSLFIADWYDPGVGGHRMQDIRHGRIFRVTPRDANRERYDVSAVNVSTPEGAVAGLKSPNMATRYLAWTAIQRFGERAEPMLRAMRESNDRIERARATWLLGKLGQPKDKTAKNVRDALGDKDDFMRIVGLRLARQLAPNFNVGDLQDALPIADPSPAVRREIFIALRELEHRQPSSTGNDALSRTWAKLAQQYDGQDRWYLEALGIAAEGHWDECLAAFEDAHGTGWQSQKPTRDILWRSRGSRTSELLAAIITDPATPDDEIPRFFRAFDFQQAEARNSILPGLAFDDHGNPPSSRVAFTQYESLSRMPGLDVSQNPQRKDVLESVLRAQPGGTQFVRLVDKFSMVDHYPGLLAIAQAQPESQLAADAMNVLYRKEQWGLIDAALKSDDPISLEKTTTAIATAGDNRTDSLLLALTSDSNRPLPARRLAVRALGASTSGASILLEIAQRRQYSDQLRDAMAAALNSAKPPSVRRAAAEIFPPSATKDSTPLPPLSQLFTMQGNRERGKTLFETTATCAKCHQVGPVGKDIGPDLSEIGKKLAKQALFEAILYPSAAISHNFESWTFITDDGIAHTGLLVSETDKDLKLKDENGIIRAIPLSTVEDRKKSEVSLMPADIQKLMSAQELVDVVEYLSTLTAK